MRTRDVTITIRCTRDERDRIRERASSRGLKLSDFVLRSALGKKIVVVDGFWELSKQLKAVGNNLNQLTRLCNEGRVKVAELKECNKTLFDIYGRLGEILREVK
ncbi:MAG: MobC family plasmid mobilization relaxosome protein [Ruminococcus sp.]|nr:MobC family plasmid mobilization relaxosome protein [Ruminococcus sp.]